MKLLNTKLRRILAGGLAVMMMLSLASLIVFADDGDNVYISAEPTVAYEVGGGIGSYEPPPPVR